MRIAAARRPYVALRVLAQQRRERRDEDTPGPARSRLFGKQERALALDEAGVEIGVRERGTRDEARQELDVVRHADDAVLRQRLQHARQRELARLVPHDELGDHRIVVRRDLVALLDAGVDAHVQRFRRRREMHELAGRRQEAAIGILGVDARLDARGRGSRAAPASAATARPAATRSCHSTRSCPVIISVTGCSTCSRVFISMKKNRPSWSAMNSTVPAPT